MEGKSLNLNEAYINSTTYCFVNGPALTTVLQRAALLLEKVARHAYSGTRGLGFLPSLAASRRVSEKLLYI